MEIAVTRVYSTIHFLKTQIRDRPHPLIKMYHTHHEYHLNVMNNERMLCKYMYSQRNYCDSFDSPIPWNSCIHEASK